MSDKKTVIGWAQQPPVNHHPAPQPQQPWPQPAPQPQYVDPYGRPQHGGDYEQPTHAQPRVPQPYPQNEPQYAQQNQYPPQANPHYAMQYPPYSQDPSQAAQPQHAYDPHGQGGYVQSQGAYDPHGQGIYTQPQGASPGPYNPSSQSFYDAHEAAYAQGTQPQTAYSQNASGYPQYTHAAHGPAHAPASNTPPHSERTIPDANATVGVSNRVRFIRLTYLHLLFSILAFCGLLYLFMTQDFLVEHVSIPLVKFALGGRWNWGVVLAVFMGVSYVADKWSHADSRGTQYMGLLFYILAESLIFVPLLAIVEWKTAAILARGGAEPHIIRDSAFVTLAIFTMLTLSVFISKKDFSFMRSGLMMASGAALSLIFLSLGFGFNLGLLFSVAMVLLAAGYVLYYTSQVLAHYDTHQHVGAALALFSSVALMFWYVIRIFLRARE